MISRYWGRPILSSSARKLFQSLSSPDVQAAGHELGRRLVDEVVHHRADLGHGLGVLDIERHARHPHLGQVLVVDVRRVDQEALVVELVGIAAGAAEQVGRHEERRRVNPRLSLLRLQEHRVGAQVGVHRRLAVDADLTGLRPAPIDLVHAPPVAHRRLARVHEVDPLVDRLRVVGVLGDGGAVVDLGARREVAGGRVAGRTAQRRHHAEITGAALVAAAPSAQHAAVADRAGTYPRRVALDQRRQRRPVAREHLLVDQALGEQAVHVAHALTPFRLHEGGHDLAVLDVEHVGVVGVQERVQQERPRARTPTVGEPGQRQLVGDAVAVRILSLERTQHLAQLLGGGGNLQAELVQPHLVDPHLLRHAAVVALLVGGEYVHVAVRPGALLEEVGRRVDHVPDVVAVLFDDVIERDEQPLRAVQVLLVVGDVHSHHHVGQLGAAVHDQGELGLGILGAVDRVPLPMDVGLLLHPLGHLVGLEIEDGARVGHECRHGDRLLEDRHHAGWRQIAHGGGAGLFLATGKHGRGAGCSQHQRQHQHKRITNGTGHIQTSSLKLRDGEAHPLIDPIRTPLTKYFCTNG